jgi:hypothetical protein
LSDRGIKDTAYVFVVRTDPIEAGCMHDDVTPLALTQQITTCFAWAFHKKGTRGQKVHGRRKEWLLF